MNTTTPDRNTYDSLQSSMRRLQVELGAAAMDQPEYQAAWRASEAIKNRHGGFVPARPPGPPDVRKVAAVFAIVILAHLAIFIVAVTLKGSM